MAIFTTDWSGELAQVEEKLIQILEEQVDPRVEQTRKEVVADVERLLQQVSEEMQQAIRQAAREVEQQRIQLVRSLWQILLAGAGLAVAGGALLIGLSNML